VLCHLASQRRGAIKLLALKQARGIEWPRLCTRMQPRANGRADERNLFSERSRILIIIVIIIIIINVKKIAVYPSVNGIVH